MAPRETSKATPKVQRIISKASKSKATPVKTIKKTMTSKNCTEKVITANNLAEPRLRPRTSTVPKMSTPKRPPPKDNNTVPLPSTVTKSTKKATWKKRPKPAHSGVPVPEKMKRLLEKQLQGDDSL